MKLVSGSGSETTGACWMSAINWYVKSGSKGFTWSDHPDCVDPVIRALCISLNDSCGSDAEREKLIGPHLFAPVGTHIGNDLTLRRAFKCADHAVRKSAVAALRSAKFNQEAGRLESLPEIVNADTAESARSAAESAAGVDGAARNAVLCARNAAWSAAERAAWSAARSAANVEILNLILELCAMGSSQPEVCRTKEEVLERLETGSFVK